MGLAETIAFAAVVAVYALPIVILYLAFRAWRRSRRRARAHDEAISRIEARLDDLERDPPPA